MLSLFFAPCLNDIQLFESNKLFFLHVDSRERSRSVSDDDGGGGVVMVPN